MTKYQAAQVVHALIGIGVELGMIALLLLFILITISGRPGGRS